MGPRPSGPGITARLLVAMALALAVTSVVAGDEPALLDVSVTGRPAGVGQFVWRDGRLHASAAQWRRYGVVLPEARADDDDALLAIDALPGVVASLDLPAQSLQLTPPPDPTRVSRIGRAGGAADGQADLAQGSGAVLNYDLAAHRIASRWHAAGLLDLRGFTPFGTLEHATIVSDSGSVRLHTTLTHVDPRRLARVRAGDLVSGGLAWTRPLRLLGVQAMTDFSLRPDLVTTPTPLLAGSTAVPSTVDVLVNGVRQLSQTVEPGRFEVRQVPTVSGLGEVSVVVRDALGRETVQTLPFYAAQRQLAAGLSAYSLEAGRVRRRFGVASADYGAAAASGSLRHGMSDRLTLEAHAEAGAGVRLAGLGGQWTLPGLGALRAGAAGSRGEGRSGSQLALGAERQTQRLSLLFDLTHASAGYRDVAAAQGDPAPRRSARLGAGLSMGQIGSVGIALVDARRDGLPGRYAPSAVRIATASYTVALRGWGQAYLSAYRDHGPGGGRGASVGVSVPLGRGGTAAAGYARDRDRSSFVVQAGDPAVSAGEFGWSAQREQPLAGDAPTRQLADLEYRAEAVHLRAGVETLGGASAWRAGARGALVALGGGLHATLPVHDSVAVVELPGTPGVAVYHENRYVGRTDEAGRVVVPGLLAFQTNRLSIDPLDLPLDAELEQAALEVRPGERSGVLLRFGVAPAHAARLLLHDARGEPLPLGALVLHAGSAEPAVIGHGGEAYVKGLRSDTRLEVRRAGRPLCAAMLRLADLGHDARRGATLRCV